MPSAEVLAADGVHAVQAGKYDVGIEKLTEALKERPAPLWYLERSKAHLRTNNFEKGLYDAEKALRVSFDRANRPQMIESQLRRAITLFRMGRYADGDVCAFWAMRLCDSGVRATEDDGQQKLVDQNGDYTERHEGVSEQGKPAKSDDLNAALSSATTQTKEGNLKKQAFTWRIQCLNKMEQLPAGHDGRKIHLTDKYPTPVEVSAAAEEPDTTSDDDEADTAQDSGATTGKEAFKKIYDLYTAMYVKKTTRCSFYQSANSLTIDIFLKNVPKDLLVVHSETDSVKLSPSPGTTISGIYGSLVLLLYGEIRPEATAYNVKSMKIELVLQKKVPGMWPTFRRENASIVDNLTTGPVTAITADQFFDFITSLGYTDTRELDLPDHDKDPDAWYAALIEKLRPAAPEKKEKKNWDKINLEDDEDEKAAKDGDVNSFFQSIYKNADPDTKRAMMKSYIESNGTSLSTNWSEAKDKTYETQPPTGSEAKKYET